MLNKQGLHLELSHCLQHWHQCQSTCLNIDLCAFHSPPQDVAAKAAEEPDGHLPALAVGILNGVQCQVPIFDLFHSGPLCSSRL